MKFLQVILLFCAGVLNAATTIDPANHYAYAANFGWMDWRGDTSNGAVIGNYVCTGNIYSANAGWINLGSGSPTNGIYYQNNSANDFGVNQDGLGNLRGYAWAANIGWINFESTGAPKVDLRSGVLSGAVWSANCGWITLSNATAQVQTDTLWPGQLATNGLPVAWLFSNFGTTNVNPSADPDGDGLSNFQEYVAGTNPNSISSALSIISASFSQQGGAGVITWTSVPTRQYYILKTSDLNEPKWIDSGLGLVSPSAFSSTAINLSDTGVPARFYRVQAVLPLP